MSFLLDFSQIEQTGIDAAIDAFNAGYLPLSGGLVIGDLEIRDAEQSLNIVGEISTKSGVIFDINSGRIGIGANPDYSFHINMATGEKDAELYLNSNNQNGESNIILLAGGGNETGQIKRDTGGNIIISNSQGTDNQITMLDRSQNQIFDIADETISINKINLDEKIKISGFLVSGTGAEIAIADINDLDGKLQYYRYLRHNSGESEKTDISFLISNAMDGSFSIADGMYNGDWISGKTPTTLVENSTYQDFWAGAERPDNINVNLVTGRTWTFEVTGVYNNYGEVLHSGFMVLLNSGEIGSFTGNFSYEFEPEQESNLFEFSGMRYNEGAKIYIGGISVKSAARDIYFDYMTIYDYTGIGTGGAEVPIMPDWENVPDLIHTIEWGYSEAGSYTGGPPHSGIDIYILGGKVATISGGAGSVNFNLPNPYINPVTFSGACPSGETGGAYIQIDSLYLHEATSYSVYDTGVLEFYDTGAIGEVPVCEIPSNEKKYRFLVTGVNTQYGEYEHSGFYAYYNGENIGSITGDFSYDFVARGDNNVLFSDICFNDKAIIEIGGISITESMNGVSVNGECIIQSGNIGDFIVGETIESKNIPKQYVITGTGVSVLRLEPEIDNYYTGDFTIYIKSVGMASEIYGWGDGVYPWTVIRTTLRDTGSSHPENINWYAKNATDWSFDVYSKSYSTCHRNYDLIGPNGLWNNGIILFNFSSSHNISGLEKAIYSKLNKENYEITTGTPSNVFNPLTVPEWHSIYGTEIALNHKSLYEFGLIDRFLTKEENDLIFSGASLLGGLGDDVGIKFLFKLNAGSGNTIYDVTNGYTGTLLNINEDYWE